MAKRVQKSLADQRSTRSLLDPVHLGSSLGIEYKHVVAETFGKLARHKLLILAIVATALVLGVVVTLSMPKRYTADAYIREGFAASDSSGAARATSGDRPISYDASLLVETRSQLFQSHQLARQVVESLGLDRLRPVIGQGPLSSWLQAALYGDATKAPGYQIDMAAAKLIRGLSVKTAPRVYQIVLRYSAEDAELAADITNAFLVAFIRMTTLQKLSGQRAAAQTALSESLATLGDKHPKVREARMRLTSVDSLIKEQLGKSPDDILKSAGENVTFAKASVIPSSPNPRLILGIALFLGIAAGPGLVLWLERKRSEKLEPTGDRSLVLRTFPKFPTPLLKNLRFTRRVIWRRALRQNG
jgi:uncharacterized protein involved in exopolysaccharide biosynthesis